MDDSRTWRHIFLGAHETSNDEDRAAFLESLQSASTSTGIWFEGGTNDDNDPIVTEILQAISQNPHVTGLSFQNMGRVRMPTAEWIAAMLRSDKIQELRIMRGNEIDLENGAILLGGISNSTSLKELCVDYPTITTLSILNLALQSDVLKLETLDIAGFMQDGYIILASVLRNCTSLKKLVLTMGVDVNLDSQIDELVETLESGTPCLEKFSFGFGYATPEAFSKLANALATKDLKLLSFGCSEDQVVLDDPTPLVRMIANNTRLEFFTVQNVETDDMSGMFLALKHDNLKQIMLTNVIKAAQNARDLGMALARNNTPIEKLEIWSVSPEFSHEPFVRSLSDGLCNSTTLKSLVLYFKQKISNEDLHALAVVLEENPRLEKLKVVQLQNEQERNTDSGLIHIGEALGRNHGLKRFHLTLGQAVGEPAALSLLEGVKSNSTLHGVVVDWVSRKQKVELDFYIGLNRGAKQALYMPLNLMAYAFERADQCRLDPEKRPRLDREEVMDTIGVETEGVEVMLAFIFAIAETRNREEGHVRSPSELYFFVRERCDLFSEAGRVARNRHDRDQCRSIASWCQDLWCFGSKR